MEQSSADKAATTDSVSTGGRRGRKRTTTATSIKNSSRQKGAKKRRKLVQDSTSLSIEANQKETLLPACMASTMADSEVQFKMKKPKKRSSVKLMSQNEPSSSGTQQVTDSPTSAAQPSIDDETEDKDVSEEDDDSLNYKKSYRETKREKSVLCPKCGRSFTSMKRLLQGHYNEEMQTCKYEKQTKQQCPCCGRHFTKLQDHYDEETGSCRANFSAAVITALSSKNTSEEQLYASLNEESTISECNAVWRRILNLFTVLKCQNANCDHKANSINAMRYHVTRCGKVIESLVCPVCNKRYTTKPGLEYHMTTKHHGGSREEPLPKLSSEPKQNKRSAAIRAAAHIAKVSMDSQPNDPQPAGTDEQPSSPGPSEDHLSEAQWATIRKAFKNKEEVKCPSANCSLTFKSYTGFKYHISRCIQNKILTCSLCNKRLTTLQRFQNHMKKIHNIEKESCLDYEYTRASDYDENEEDDEEEDDEKKQKLQAPHRNYRGLKNMYEEQLENLLQELTSHEELFTDWQPSLKSWTRCRDCALHAPVTGHSVKFCFASSKNGTSPVSQLALFDAALEDEQYGVTAAIFNVGGPVWSMAWAPSEEDIQYVAMAAYRTLDETHRMDTPIEHKGLIQLWTMLIDKLELPRLSLGIAHDYGCIRSMKWCPSGCATKLPSMADSSEIMSRLGLLALACSDGVARILSIPQPSELLERLGPMKNDNNCYNVFVTPESICCLLSPGNITTSQSNLSTLYGQCWDVEWLPRQTHNKIAAGFSNGTVTIWDLSTKSWLLRGSHDHCDTVMYPQLHISAAHLGNICRTISWCPDDPNYLFTAGYDKRVCLWDLNHPEEPADKWDKGLCWDSQWALLCPGVFYLEDCARTEPYVKNLSFQEFQTGKPASVIRCSIPQISFSYSHWTSTVAFGTITGEVWVKTLPPFIYLFRKPKFKHNDQTCCVCARLCDEKENDKVAMKDGNDKDSPTDNKFLTFYNYPENNEHQLEFRPDMEPVTAVSKIAWNPCHRYCHWLLMATNTGLVRLLKL